MQNPFIPKKRADLIIISEEASDEIVYNLINKDIEVIKTKKLNSVSPEICYHPDLALHPISANTLVVAPEVFDYYCSKLNPYGLHIMKGSNNLGEDYPDDIAYNIVRIGNHFVHKKTYTDKKIQEYYRKIAINLVPVSQGYAKCSTALVDEYSAITSDRIIADKLRKRGYDILLVESGGVDLPGYPYGFIGGASGHISPKEIVFTGSLNKHPDKASIEAFIKDKGIEIIYLSKDKIIDLGSIFSFSL